MEVEISPTGRPVQQELHVGEARDGDAAGPELALGHRVVVVVAVQGRHVVRDAQAGAAGGDQLLEPVVGVLGGAEAGEHAHRPQAPAMPGGVDAARERWLAGQAQVVDHVPAGGGRGLAVRAEPVARAVRIRVVRGVSQVGGRVHPIDLDPGLRDETRATLRRALQGGILALARPSVLVLAPALVIGHAGKCAGWTDGAATGHAECIGGRHVRSDSPPRDGVAALPGSPQVPGVALDASPRLGVSHAPTPRGTGLLRHSPASSRWYAPTCRPDGRPCRR